MYQLILIIHIFAAICVVALVLVQQGKGATMGAAFGAGASQTVFGSRGSGSFLFRLTIGMATVFFLTSIALNYVTSHAIRQEKVVTLPAVPTKPASTAPATPTTHPAPATTPATKKQAAHAPNVHTVHTKPVHFAKSSNENEHAKKVIETVTPKHTVG